ncbi:Hypothetical protein, putative [Bodo saltans]|uniref:Uncharacterized protein n=1 Tax=Bodo saltans TaxID=75058 RepID=A0A0S4IMG3_BODSA|nr:Hypothetical protein, putative [Bodo saltans]|eukprot:CUE73530.1 Hypothetical protein, putative [Bodo saltans]
MGTCVSSPSCCANSQHDTTMKVCYDRSKVLKLQQQQRQKSRRISSASPTEGAHNPLATTPPSAPSTHGATTGFSLADQSGTVSGSGGLLHSTRLLTSSSTTGGFGSPQHYLHVGPITSDIMTNLSPLDGTLFSSMNASRPIVVGTGQQYVYFETNDEVGEEDCDPLTAASAFVPLSLPSYESRRLTMKDVLESKSA